MIPGSHDSNEQRRGSGGPPGNMDLVSADRPTRLNESGSHRPRRVGTKGDFAGHVANMDYLCNRLASVAAASPGEWCRAPCPLPVSLANNSQCILDVQKAHSM